MEHLPCTSDCSINYEQSGYSEYPHAQNALQLLTQAVLTEHFKPATSTMKKDKDSTWLEEP